MGTHMSMQSNLGHSVSFHRILNFDWRKGGDPLCWQSWEKLSCKMSKKLNRWRRTGREFQTKKSSQDSEARMPGTALTAWENEQQVKGDQGKRKARAPRRGALQWGPVVSLEEELWMSGERGPAHQSHCSGDALSPVWHTRKDRYCPFL